MAKLNGLYIFVERESVKNSIESTTHPTETGLPITSSIKKQPIELSISGRIVDNDKYDVETTKEKIKKLMTTGSLITYKGRVTLKNAQIQSFDGDYDNKTWGGFVFTLELKQVRIAKSSYTEKKKTVEAQKQEKKSNPTLEVGATVVFTGGSVYVSSDAKKAAANRGRSTCKITKISTKSWSVHQYHLISTDGKMVYGWVDKSKIEGVGSSATNSKTNGGTKQTTSGTGTEIRHTVKKGDTVYALVGKYGAGKSCQWVIDNNPSAFSRKGDATTLQIGKNLLLGYK